MAKTAGILLIGNEILSGKIADANAAYLCRELRALGVEVRQHHRDPRRGGPHRRRGARVQRARYDVVFTSGGVGPTHDDVTIEGVARALGVPVIRDAAAGRACSRATTRAGSTRRGSRWPRCRRARS